jgi:DNA primase
LQEIERIDFRDAVKQLAKSENIDIGKYQFDKNKVEEYADEKEKIKRIHKLAQTFFKDELTKDEPALKYLKEKRKLDDETIDKFGI